MKKLSILVILFLYSFLSLGQTKTKYSEFNTGLSVGAVPIFPGASLLIGKTITYNSGLIFDYQGGLAFPSIITGKIGFGYAIQNDAEITVGVRPWPTTSYLQMKLNRPEKRTDLVFSVEKIWGGDFFIQDAIFTIGWRHSIKK